MALAGKAGVCPCPGRRAVALPGAPPMPGGRPATAGPVVTRRNAALGTAPYEIRGWPVLRAWHPLGKTIGTYRLDGADRAQLAVAGKSCFHRGHGPYSKRGMFWRSGKPRAARSVHR
jgi:hypothetical protein